MQPREFYAMLDAYEQRRKDEDYRRAYFVSWIIRPHVKDAIPPDDIYRPLYYTQEEIQTMKEEKAKQDLEFFKEGFGREAGE